MKLTDLTKDELCELLKRILTSRLSPNFVINRFLCERQERKFNELMTEIEKTDIVKALQSLTESTSSLISCTTIQIIIYSLMS